MHRTVLTITLLGLMHLTMAQDHAGDPAVKEITPQALSALLAEPHVHVIDVNEDFTYAEAHVPGAKRSDYDAITLDLLPEDKGHTLVFYCWSPECPAAETAAETAIKLGFTAVYCMHAGITGWQDAGLPTEP